MEQAFEVPPRTRRQQAWLDAHETAERYQVGDVFGWWCVMRLHGRVDPFSDQNLSSLVHSVNALQVRPLPLSGDEWDGP